MVRTFTVINFNPVPLTLEGELGRYSVPTPFDHRLPATVQRVSFEWQGRERFGHALTLREPHIFGKMVSAVPHNGDKAYPIPQRQVEYYLPIAIAYAFLEHYSPIFVTHRDQKVAAPPKDARRIYGVLAYEGDLSALNHYHLQQSDRKIKVPIARQQTVGARTQRSYTTVDCDLDEYLEEMFGGQLRFADGVITRAQARFAEGGESIKEIGDNERAWYRWAIEQGYVEQPKRGEKTWLYETITLRPEVTGQLAGGSKLRKCQGCTKVEPAENTPFCPSCGAPIDTYETYMAGFPVADAWLEAVKEPEKLQAIRKERLRRSQVLGVQEQPKNGGKRGSYKGGAKDEKKEEHPDPTALPGEETEETE